MTKEQIFEFIRERKVSFLASVDSDGYPNVKAMLSPRKITENEIYFSTNSSSMRVEQFTVNPKACVYFYKKGRFHYIGVMLIGIMRILHDEETKKEIWRDGDALFYKKGVCDPDYCVLKFTAQKGRYYRDLKTENFDL